MQTKLFSTLCSPEHLQRLVRGITQDTEIIRLIMLCVKMGAVTKNLSWRESEAKKASPEAEAKEENRKVVLKRKHEYRKLEEEHAELVLSRPGMALGLSGNRVTVKEKGLVMASVPTGNLKHISVLGSGVSVSSNILKHLLENKIPLDIFGPGGKHIGTFLSTSSFQCQRWQLQALCPQEQRNRLGASIIEGKLTNQLNLLKYFHKYHKARTAEYQPLLDEMEALAPFSQIPFPGISSWRFAKKPGRGNPN